MRVAVILGRRGCSPKLVKPFQEIQTVEWRVGMPASAADAVLLFGGDGTIHHHLYHLVQLNLPVLVVPVGSGNDFARALGLKSVRDAVKAWRQFCRTKNNVRCVDLGIVRPLDTGKAVLRESASISADHYFCCIAGVGLDAELTRRANQLPRWLRAHGGYALSLLPAMFGFAPLPMRILTRETDTQNNNSNNWTIRSNQPTMLAVFANTSTYGGGMRIAPQARMEDGMLDCCVVGGMSPFKLACLFPTVYFGRHLRVREVSYSQASEARLESERPLDVYADGEFVCRTPVEFGVQRDALKVIVP